MKTRLQILALILAAACSAYAQGTYEEGIVDYNGGGAGPVAGTIGYSFRPLADVEVSDLGWADNGFTGQPIIQMGIWTTNGALLASSTVTSADTPYHLSRYSSITPLALLAGLALAAEGSR